MTKAPVNRLALVACTLLVGVTLSCDAGPTSVVQPGTRAINSLSAQLLGLNLLSCTSMEADSVTQLVGAGGGSISVGPHTLVIPSGALDSTVSITAIAPSDTINRVDLYPEGLEFNEDVYLALNYANCGLLSPLIPKRVVYLEGLSIEDLLPSVDFFFAKTVIGTLEHFSGYAVAW